MSLEKRLSAAAKEVTGDDSIIDVAEFMPKGSMGAQMAGAAAGSLAGGAVGDSWGSAIGMAGGMAAGRAAVGLTKDLPPFICVAASPTTVYLLGMRSQFRFKNLDLLAQIAREDLGVEVHQKASVRTVILEDLTTEQRFALEVPRVNYYHGKAMVELLMLSEEHQHDEPSEEEIEAANAE